MSNIETSSIGPHDKRPPSVYFRNIVKELRDSGYKSDFTREYTSQLLSMFSGLRYINAESKIVEVTTIYGSPERAVGKRNEKLSLILPLASLTIHSFAEGAERQKYEPLINFETIFDKNEQRHKRVVSLLPKPVKLNYQFNLYSKFIEDLNQLAEKIELKFNPSLKIPVSFDSQAQAFVTDRQEAVSTILGDRQDRVVKRSFVFSIETYIPAERFLVTNTGHIEKFNQELFLTDFAVSADPRY